jgi:hypothetical protein
MNTDEKKIILERAKSFFREKIVQNHIRNTRKLKHVKEFHVNPFLLKYLANFLTGGDDAKSMAKALIYPRVLGTSINTSFGTNLQYFCSNVLAGYASTTSGIDIEFIDQVDFRKKFCQIKSGPNTINKDDIDTIKNHFTSIRNLARTNQLCVGVNDMVVGVLYGTREEISGHYKTIDREYPVIVGQEFWHRLTGDEWFYEALIQSLGEVANEYNGKNLLEEMVDELANEILEKQAKDSF